MLKRILLLILSGILIGGIAKAQDAVALEIDSFIRKAHSDGRFNGNVEVIDKGKEIYKTAIGFADTSKQRPLGTQYSFHIGSISKEFSAVGIMMLKEQGKLNLDDKVSKYITVLPAWAGKVSIKNLLQYTSGLPDVKWKTVKGDADNWADLKVLQQLDAEPGTSYAYNNNNNFLQKAIIAKITGMSFNDFVVQRILKPCGMNSSVVDPTDEDVQVAKSFNNSGKQAPLVYPISGWVCVTLDDLVKWNNAIANFKLIGPESTRVILVPTAESRQSGFGGGKMAGNKMLTHIHNGAAQNYQAILDANIPKGRLVILLSNNKQNNIGELDEAIQEILDGSN